MERLLTVKEFAEILNIPRSTVYFYIQSQKIAPVRIGGRYKIHESEKEKILNQGLEKKVVIKKPLGKSHVLKMLALVIDDQPMIREVLADYLEENGYRT